MVVELVTSSDGRSHAYREVLTEEFLRAEYLGTRRPLADIAAEVGCSVHALYTSLDHHGLGGRGDNRKGEPRPDWTDTLTAEFLREWYTRRGLGAEQVASKVGCSHTTVLRALTRHGIASHPPTSIDGHVYADDTDSRQHPTSAARRRKAEGRERPRQPPRTEVDTARIDQMRNEGATYAEIAEAVGVSRTLVWRHCTGQR